MNKIILLGRLVRDPEVRYGKGSEAIAVASYTLAVNKRFKKKDEAEADFINCIAFGKAGEFAEKYFKKGQMVSVIGRLQVRSWDDNGSKRWSTEVVIEEQYFTGKNEGKSEGKSEGKKAESRDGFYNIDTSVEDEDLPF